jgi:hypothetical protein
LMRAMARSSARDCAARMPVMNFPHSGIAHERANQK